MSDFTSDFWNIYITVIAIVSIFLCAWLIWWTSSDSDANEDGEVKTMGHVWDEDLEEFNNPLPGWWKNMFYSSIVFALLYLALYPGLGTYKGLLNWTQINQLEDEEQVAKDNYGPIYAQYANLPIQNLAADPVAVKMGKRLYLTYCTTCHGSDAGGVTGYPDLRDNDWLYGGSPEQIEASIANGRNGFMPAHKAILGEDGVEEVLNYVMSLSYRSSLDAEMIVKGKEKFAKSCAGCHTPSGKGMHALGAPNLTDNIWLYGRTKEQIRHSIAEGRKAQMPPHKDFLGPEKVHLIAAYVFRLSQ